MSKIYENVIQPFVDTSIAASSTDSTTCEWLDCSGWVDKIIEIECDSSGSIDVDINLLVSSKGAYELNNETTVDTEDYQSFEIKTAHAVGTVTRYTDADNAILRQPIRTAKITLDNDDASDAVVVNLRFEGQS